MLNPILKDGAYIPSPSPTLSSCVGVRFFLLNRTGGDGRCTADFSPQLEAPDFSRGSMPLALQQPLEGAWTAIGPHHCQLQLTDIYYRLCHPLKVVGGYLVELLDH